MDDMDIRDVTRQHLAEVLADRGIHEPYFRLVRDTRHCLSQALWWLTQAEAIGWTKLQSGRSCRAFKKGSQI